MVWALESADEVGLNVRGVPIVYRARGAERHRGQYDQTDFALPETVEVSDAYLEGKPMWVKNQRNSWHGMDFPLYTGESIEALYKSYCEALSSVDDSIGVVMAQLKKSPRETARKPRTKAAGRPE